MTCSNDYNEMHKKSDRYLKENTGFKNKVFMSFWSYCETKPPLLRWRMVL